MISFRTLMLAAALGTASMIQAQTPASAERHALTSFDNGYANTLPVPVYDRGHNQDRYGFKAMFEVRVAPGVVKERRVQRHPEEEARATTS